MEECHTCYVCDECGWYSSSENKVIFYRVDGGLEYHVCSECIPKFAERVKEEEDNAG